MKRLEEKHEALVKEKEVSVSCLFEQLMKMSVFSESVCTYLCKTKIYKKKKLVLPLMLVLPIINVIWA